MGHVKNWLMEMQECVDEALSIAHEIGFDKCQVPDIAATAMDIAVDREVNMTYTDSVSLVEQEIMRMKD